MLANKFFYSKIFFSFFLFARVEIDANKLSCEISAPIAILINAENGRVLFEKRAHERCYPASTTKVATALYALYKKNKEMQDFIIVSQDAVGIVSPQVRRYSGKHPSYRLEFGGTHAGMKPGEEVDALSVLYAVMLASANDACNVLAEWTCGSVTNFMAELNLFLQKIGCSDTYFTNPHGLPDDEHVTTAADLAKMAYFAKKYPLFRKVVATTKYEYPATNKQTTFWMSQTNALLKPGKFYYPYATGIKTGYTQKAGHNLIASACKGDRDLIAVICGCDERSKRYRSAVDLFETAFNEPKNIRKLLSKEHDLFSKQIEGAKYSLEAVLESDLSVSFYPSEEPILSPKIDWFSLSLPIPAGSAVGVVRVFDAEGKEWVNVNLRALKAVDPTWQYVAKGYARALGGWLRMHKIYAGYILALTLLWIPIFLLKKKRLKRRRNRIL